MTTKINLTEILKKHSNIFDDYEGVIDAMKEACSKVLELAADNASLTSNGSNCGDYYYIDSDDTFLCNVEIQIDKNSITEMIKYVES